MTQWNLDANEGERMYLIGQCLIIVSKIYSVKLKKKDCSRRHICNSIHFGIEYDMAKSNETYLNIYILFL